MTYATQDAAVVAMGGVGVMKMSDDLTLKQLREWLAWYCDMTAEKAREHRDNNAGPIAAWVQSQSSLAGMLVTCIDEGRLPTDDDVRMY